MRTARAITQAVESLGLVAALPGVEALPGDPVVATGGGDVAGHFLSVLKDRQPSLGLSVEMSFGHQVCLS
jgi:hypothetical protein